MALLSSAEDLGDPGRGNSYGHDLVNTLNAVYYLFEKVGAASTPTPPPPTTTSGFPVCNMNFTFVVKTDGNAIETSW
jgi:hypothetical protein